MNLRAIDYDDPVYSLEQMERRPEHVHDKTIVCKPAAGINCHDCYGGIVTAERIAR